MAKAMAYLSQTITLAINTHTHTHNRFMAFLDFVRDYLGEPAPERYKKA